MSGFRVQKNGGKKLLHDGENQPIGLIEHINNLFLIADTTLKSSDSVPNEK